MILSALQLQQLTGYRQRSAQVRWLVRNGWRFTVNGLGHPIVAEAEFNQRLVGGRSASSQQPNFGALSGSQAHA